MLESAQKLGMDFGDLEEYGLDVRSSNCGGKTCFNKEKFKTYDDILSTGSKLGSKIGEEGAKLYRRA